MFVHLSADRLIHFLLAQMKSHCAQCSSALCFIHSIMYIGALSTVRTLKSASLLFRSVQYSITGKYHHLFNPAIMIDTWIVALPPHLPSFLPIKCKSWCTFRCVSVGKVLEVELQVKRRCVLFFAIHLLKKNHEGRGVVKIRTLASVGLSLPPSATILSAN